MKIISWNIANYDDHPNWEIRKKLIVAELIKEKPDMIALQEVRFNAANASTKESYQNTAEQIFDLLQQDEYFAEYNLIVQPVMHYPANPRHTFWEGLAIISRYEIPHHGFIKYQQDPQNPDTNKRGVIYGIAQLPEEDLCLANTHFSYDQKYQAGNAEDLLELVEQFMEVPFMVLGDFNTICKSEAMMKLECFDLVNAWKVLSDEFEEDETYPASAPEVAIDQIWVNQLLAERLVSIRRIGLESVEDIFASDHFGLCLELTLTE